ncbi:MAG: RNA polymerase sigma factor [Actinomycetota bacterium]
MFSSRSGDITADPAQPSVASEGRVVVHSGPIRDERWIQELFVAHSRQVLAFALRRLTREDAEELVGEVFTIAWRRRTEIPSDVNELAWLYGVARHRVSAVNTAASSGAGKSPSESPGTALSR